MNKTNFDGKITNFDGESVERNFIGLPEECPQCNKGQAFGLPFFIREGTLRLCYCYFQCRFSECRTPFFGVYRRVDPFNYGYVSNEVPSYTKPMEEIPEFVDSISLSYRKIYTQAFKAEESNLDLIAGCGYRKAIEFLIKDYAISLVKQDKTDDQLTEEQQLTINKIKKAQLGTVITNYLDIPKVKSMAARATWIGNDETHYERRLEQGDITIMKDLMRLTILHIETEELTKKMETEIQPAI